MRTVVIATTNQGKVDELKSLLSGATFKVFGLADLEENYPGVKETEATFRGNAVLKARYYYEKTGLLTLADDSGLVVDALGGRPGVLSARYGPNGSTSAEQIRLVLDEMKEVSQGQRTARFVCCIALVGKKIEQVFEQSCEGWIGYGPRGEHGFGYDPIFIDTQSGHTFGELTREEKASRSHRAKALRLALAYLEDPR